MCVCYCSVPAWCVVRGVHPPASVRFRVGEPSPSCLIIHPLVFAPPAVRFCFYPGAAPRPAEVLHMSAPVRRDAVADACLGPA